MSRLLRRLDLPRKKKSLHASERDTERVLKQRARYRRRARRLDPRRCKFIDESGVNVAMTRRYGRAPRGQRVFGSVAKSATGPPKTAEIRKAG